VPSAPFLVPPLLLIVVLAVSGAAKLRHADDTRSVMRKLKLPELLFTIRAPRLLPWGELLVAALLLLLPGPGYVVAATLALLLFAAYVVVVARALSFDYQVICGCFGRLGLGWITKQTLVRNSVLLGLALVLWADSWRGDGVLSRMADLDEAGWWWLAGIAVTIVVTGLVVRESRPPFPQAQRQRADTYAARATPYGVVDGPEGPVSLWKLSDAAARLLVFWDPRVDPAGEVAARLPVWQEQLGPVRVHLVSNSEWAPATQLWPELADVLLGDPDDQTRVSLGLYETPGAVLLGTDRILAGGPSTGIDEIEELVAAAAEEIQAAMPMVGRESVGDQQAMEDRPETVQQPR
jgi:Methylamine utilisation protein MauE